MTVRILHFRHGMLSIYLYKFRLESASADDLDATSGADSVAICRRSVCVCCIFHFNIERYEICPKIFGL